MFRNLKKIVNILMIFLILSILLSSCSGSQDQKDVNNEENQTEDNRVENHTPVRGGTLFLHCMIPDTLNPLLSKSKTVKQSLNLIYEGLVELGNDMKAKPVLAERWEVSPDALIWTFYLRKNVKWHDNTIFTADDVEYTLKLLTGAGYDSTYKANVQQILSFTVLDEYTVRITLNRPNSGFVNLMTFPIVPKHQFKPDNLDPVGTGPYRFEEYNTLKYIKLVANDSWWGENSPYIDYVYIKIIPDHDTALYTIEAKEIDMIFTDIIDWEKYSSKDNLEVKEYMTNFYDFLGINFNNKILNENAVRKAIAYAIDRDTIINEVFLGHAKKADVPINPEMWLFDVESQVYHYDPQKARELLMNAGWADANADGIFDKLFDNLLIPLSFEILVNEDNNVRVKVGELIVKNLCEIGMNVTLKKVSWEEMNTRIDKKLYDVVLGEYNLSEDADLSFLFHSSAIEKETNFILYNNPQMDSLLWDALVQTGDEARKQAFSQLQKYIIDELPYISLYFRTSAVIYNTRIKGNINPNFNNIYNDIEKLYIR